VNSGCTGCTGYTYDAFGRTTALPGSTIAYYTNDLVQRQTAGTQRQTWTLDSTLRFRAWTTETNNAGTWTWGLGHLRRLAYIRDLLRTREGVRAQRTRLLLFSGAGFTDDLRRLAANEPDVQLIDPERLYQGE
jgi:hypothetical protein